MKVQKDTGNFLNTEDVENGQVVTISGKTVEEVESQYGSRLQIGIIVNGKEKVASLNPTSRNFIIEAYGDETDDWKGNELRVHVVNTKVGKAFKDVIYFTHPNKDLEGKEINR